MNYTRVLTPALMGLMGMAPLARAQQTCLATEDQKLVADDWEADARNGYAVSLSGDTLVSGAWLDNHSGAKDAGAAYVFVRAGSVWSQQAKLIASDPMANTRLGTSVAVDGDTAAVASSSIDTVYVFERSGTTWSETAKLDALGFGRRVSISGDTLAVAGGGAAGRVKILVRNGADWQVRATVLLGGTFNDGLSLDGDTFVANVGSTAKIFVRSGTTWSQEAALTGGVQLFADSVAVRGDRLVLGSPIEGSNTGAAHVYERSGASWSWTQTLVASDGASGDYFGRSVALAAGRILVGAPDATLPLSGGGFAFDSGAAYSFVPGVDGWVEQAKLAPSAPINFEDTAFGLAVDGNHVAAGASFSFIPPTGSRSGAVYVFDLAGLEPLAYCTSGTSASGCGANLTALGVASASAATGFVVSAAEVEGDKTGLYYFGTSGRIGNPWGTGSSFKCVALPAARGALISSGGTSGACDGTFTYDLNARWMEKPAANPGAGAVVQVQLWYRDPNSAGNKGTSYSDALEFPVCP